MDQQPAFEFSFDFLGSKPIVVEPSAAQLTSDTGLLPFRELDERIGLTRQFADALDDRRHTGYIDHTFLVTVHGSQNHSEAGLPMNGTSGIMVNTLCVVKSLAHSGPNELLGLCPAVVRALRGRELVASPVSRQVILLGIAHGGIFPHHESAGSEQDGEQQATGKANCSPRC